MDYKKMEAILSNMLHGNRRDAVELITSYGLYDFWSDYRDYLKGWSDETAFKYFTDAVISYHHITYR